MHLEWEACNAVPGWKGFQGLEREEEGRKERRKGLEGRRGAGRSTGEEEEAGATAPRRLRSGRLAGGTHQLPLDHPPWSIPLTSHVNAHSQLLLTSCLCLSNTVSTQSVTNSDGRCHQSAGRETWNRRTDMLPLPRPQRPALAFQAHSRAFSALQLQENPSSALKCEWKEHSRSFWGPSFWRAYCTHDSE